MKSQVKKLLLTVLFVAVTLSISASANAFPPIFGVGYVFGTVLATSDKRPATNFKTVMIRRAGCNYWSEANLTTVFALQKAGVKFEIAK